MEDLWKQSRTTETDWQPDLALGWLVGRMGLIFALRDMRRRTERGGGGFNLNTPIRLTRHNL